MHLTPKCNSDGLKPPRNFNHAALNHFEKAIELDANNQEAYFWVWKVNELVGRPYTVVEDIWKAIELAPDELQSKLLRDWYMGEFFALTANAAAGDSNGIAASRRCSLKPDTGRAVPDFHQ